MGRSAQTLWEAFQYFPPAMRRFVWLILLVVLLSGCQSQPRLRVVAQETTPLLEVAARELGAQLEQAGYQTEVATGPEASAGEINAIILSLDESAPDLQPEGFRITSLRASGFLLFRVVGKDSRGIVWGSQELAERIITGGRLEPVSVEPANRRLPLRAIGLPLPLPEASESLGARNDPREQWRMALELLSRSRFNAIFLRTTQPVTRFAEVPEEGASSPEVKAHREWLRTLFQMARDRGLDCYVWLTRASLEGWPSPSTSSSSEAEPNESPTRAEQLVKTALPAILRSYPELAGVALDMDVLALAEPPERGRWIVENVLTPLGEARERRPIFLGVGDGWQALREELSGVASDSPLYLLAALPPREDSLPAGEYPVLWKLEFPPSVLSPWEDPGAVRAALQRIETRDTVGFLDASFLNPRPEGRRTGSRNGERRLASLEDNWFRLLLWGRLGYSPDIPDQNWVEQFVRRFGNRAGLPVYLAAAHSSRILDWLPRDEDDSARVGQEEIESPGLPDSTRPFLLQRSLLQPEAASASGSVVTQVMREKGWLLSAESEHPEPSSLVSDIEQEARQALAEADTAQGLGAWRGEANEGFHQRIRSVAEAGLAWAEYRRAALDLARFALDGEETDRQQALERMQTAQQMLAAASAPGSPAVIGPLDRLRPQIAEAIEMIPKLQPWPWEKTRWEVGTVARDQAASLAEAPLPTAWTAVETSRLREFGPYGQQPWMASLNQQLRSAFLTAPKEAPPAPGTLFVGRTHVSVPAPGQLMIRVVSTQPGTVWVNRRRAIPVPPPQSLWNATAPPSLPLRIQFFAQPVPTGNAEVIVSTPADNSALIALDSLFVPEARNIIRLQAPDAAQLTGVIFVPGVEAAPQPHLALRESFDAGSETNNPGGTASRATFRFSVPEPGFYRIRLWCLWETARRTGLDLFLDGSRWQQAVGQGDPITQRWHWLPVETAAALGAGEHWLAITGWNPGAQVGIVEIVQQDAGAGRE